MDLFKGSESSTDDNEPSSDLSLYIRDPLLSIQP